MGPFTVLKGKGGVAFSHHVQSVSDVDNVRVYGQRGRNEEREPHETRSRTSEVQEVQYQQCAWVPGYASWPSMTRLGEKEHKQWQTPAPLPQ